jgi:hypothetical protein
LNQEFELALFVLRHFLEFEQPLNPGAHNLMGLILESQGEKEKAEQAFKASLNALDYEERGNNLGEKPSPSSIYFFEPLAQEDSELSIEQKRSIVLQNLTRVSPSKEEK